MQGDWLRVWAENLPYSVTKPHGGGPMRIRNAVCVAPGAVWACSRLPEHNSEHCFNTYLMGFSNSARR